MISATVTGNLGRDPELKYYEGNPILSFSVASRRYDKKAKNANDKGEVTDWVNVTYWGKRAEGVSKHLAKGGRVAVRGALWVREYEHNGSTRFSTELRADDVELLGSAEKRNEERASTGAQPLPPSHEEQYGGSDIPF